MFPFQPSLFSYYCKFKLGINTAPQMPDFGVSFCHLVGLLTIFFPRNDH